MRGKVSYCPPVDFFHRITPAYAGKSFFLFSPFPLLTGSPPPMRGKVKFYTSGGTGVRITPAYAGKSRSHSLSSSGLWDHPRLCGEKSHAVPAHQRRLGSPPPMRGKASCPAFSKAFPRITPAYAGKRHCFR